ncbi:MAG: ATP synthase F0 subunit B [Oscillospiraceae bacterium]|nr:ATP synthase F0 subunit B [Oscillospiraceae bacterium]
MSINFSEVIWTIICFFALLFVLKKLFFGPLIRNMDARRSRIEAGEEEIRRTEEAREGARREADEQWEERNREARHMLNEGMARDDKIRSEALEETHRRAAQTLADAREETQHAEEMSRRFVSSRGEELARALADRLLGGQKEG